MTETRSTAEAPSVRQQAIVPSAAFAAVGDMSRLGSALNQGLDAGMTVNNVKEVLVQLFAYAGFPRSLNALGEFMKEVEARKQRGIQVTQGPVPTAPFPKVMPWRQQVLLTKQSSWEPR